MQTTFLWHQIERTDRRMLNVHNVKRKQPCVYYVDSINAACLEATANIRPYGRYQLHVYNTLYIILYTYVCLLHISRGMFFMDISTVFTIEKYYIYGFFFYHHWTIDSVCCNDCAHRAAVITVSPLAVPSPRGSIWDNNNT